MTLELGGKSSAIVLPDADLEAMAAVLIRSSMRNSGQTCYISTRILAPAERYDEVVDMVTRTVAAARQGDPFDEDTVFGPLATAAQRDVVAGFLESARERGGPGHHGRPGPAGTGRATSSSRPCSPTSRPTCGWPGRRSSDRS